METTLEVRWFGPGRSPDEVDHRFDALGAPGPEARTDTYVLLDGTDDLGVKLREAGKALEFKLRQHDFGDSKVATVSGNLERWQKWSFPVEDATCRSAALGLPSGSLVEVEKRRRLVIYRLAPDGSAVKAEQRSGDGTSVEITSLAAKGSEWWSLGFEAFGSQDRLADALTASAEAFFADASGLSDLLAGALSCGYPEWLQEIA
jgi:hypothetical protein